MPLNNRVRGLRKNEVNESKSRQQIKQNLKKSKTNKPETDFLAAREARNLFSHLLCAEQTAFQSSALSSGGYELEWTVLCQLVRRSPGLSSRLTDSTAEGGTQTLDTVTTALSQRPANSNADVRQPSDIVLVRIFTSDIFSFYSHCS